MIAFLLTRGKNWNCKPIVSYFIAVLSPHPWGLQCPFIIEYNSLQHISSLSRIWLTSKLTKLWQNTSSCSTRGEITNPMQIIDMICLKYLQNQTETSGWCKFWQNQCQSRDFQSDSSIFYQRHLDSNHVDQQKSFPNVDNIHDP